MRKTVIVMVVALICLAVPLSASQFIHQPFDKIVRTSKVIVHGKVGPVTSAWNSEGEVIFSRANIEVTKYLLGDGPAIIPLREVGGTVNGYTQQAIGFPELREGEEVVLILTKWDDSDEFRIHAYQQGKYEVRQDSNGKLRVLPSESGQGEANEVSIMKRSFDDAGYAMSEFEQMVEASLIGGRTPQRQ
jgi:hypothetical protein